MRLFRFVVVAFVLLGAGFAVGRWSVPRNSTAPHVVPDGESAPEGSPRRWPGPTLPPGGGRGAGPAGEETTGAAPVRAGEGVGAAGTVDPTPLALDRCHHELEEARTTLESEHRRQREAEGAPFATPAEVPTRLRQDALLQAATQALHQSRVPGRVETIDCVEYPCILYGRINGDEDMIERVERARAFKAYDDDILRLLSWTATDEAARERGHRAETRPERMLIAIAIYTQQDRALHGDNIDRRVRVRTADLWNALRPDDEE